MPRSILRFGAWMVLGGIPFVAAGLTGEEQPPVAKAPAFGAADLVRLPARNWITNGGNIYNQRYSTLSSDQSRQRQGNVKAVWRVGLNGSGVGPGYSQQAQVLFYEGVIYVVTGDNDVFAVDVETGKFLWTYEGDVDFDQDRRLLRAPEPRPRARRRQDLSRPDRRTARRTRSADRQSDLGRARGRSRARLRHHGGAALLRRQGHHGIHRR